MEKFTVPASPEAPVDVKTSLAQTTASLHAITLTWGVGEAFKALQDNVDFKLLWQHNHEVRQLLLNYNWAFKALSDHLLGSGESQLGVRRDSMNDRDYRQLAIKRRADCIRDALAGKDRPETNKPAEPFMLFGKPIDSMNFDEVLVAAVEWSAEQERRNPFARPA